jgi:hypothetical protein
MVLLQVVTIREAAMMYQYSESTVRYHLAENHLTFRKASGYKNSVILIDGASLIALWGEPKCQIGTLISNNLQLS